MSIKARCLAELKMAHKQYKGDVDKINTKMQDVISTIVLCFKGYCGESCRKHSLVCSGNYRQVKSYMPSNCKLKMTTSDENILCECIKVLLGPQSIMNTRFLTSTQKSEAVNRAYQACMPKSVTFSRNCHGRIHGQILRLNHGFANSTVLKTSALRCALTKGSSVIKRLLKLDEQYKRIKSERYINRQKATRFAYRMRNYQVHSEVHYQKGISDPKPDFSKFNHLKDHAYV